jgi:hypothetical protein
MLQGLLITTWEQDFQREPRLSKLAEANGVKEEEEE